MYLGNRAKTNFKYDTPVKAIVQPRPVMTVNDQIKLLRNKPVRNAKRVYAGVKIRSQSHNDNADEPVTLLPESSRPHYNTIENGLPFDDDEETAAEVITKDDLFICVSTDECDAADQITRKRRRSTGNITPKEISTGATETQLAERTVNSSEVNTVISESSSSCSEQQEKVEQAGGTYGSVFDDYETGLDIDWREQLWCLTESLSFDATISDQNKQPVLVSAAAASEIPATPLAAALAALQNVI